MQKSVFNAALEIEHVFGTNLALVSPACFVWSAAASRDRSSHQLYYKTFKFNF